MAVKLKTQATILSKMLKIAVISLQWTTAAENYEGNYMHCDVLEHD